MSALRKMLALKRKDKYTELDEESAPSNTKFYSNTDETRAPGQHGSSNSPEYAHRSSNSVEHAHGPPYHLQNGLSIGPTTSLDTSKSSTIEYNARYDVESELFSELPEDKTSFEEAHEAARPLLFDCLNCPPRQEIHSTRLGWSGWITIFLSLFTTVGSFLNLVCSLIGPSWPFIGTNGVITATTASMLVSGFSRCVMAGFLYCFLHFLGQIHSRRMIQSDSKGMSISELWMKEWITQPAMLLTNPSTLKVAFMTLKGLAAVAVTFLAFFYPTAAVTCNAPSLLLGSANTRVMSGKVMTSYANPEYIMATCQTPITLSEDPEYSSSTCLEMEHAALAYTNFLGYMSTWAEITENGGQSGTSLASRPPVTGFMYQNTTVQGSWIETKFSDMTESQQNYGRIINNVTVAMPHFGIFAAARDQINGIEQPSGITGEGSYQLRTAVPAPALNVMCVNAEEKEIAPLVYTSWPGSNYTSVNDSHRVIQNSAEWNAEPPWPKDNIYGNSTVLDGIFGWNEEYGNQRPAFPMFPLDYNTVLAATTNYSNNALHILLKSSATSNYTACRLRSYLSSNCSSDYRVTASHGNMVSVCEESDNEFAFLDQKAPVYSADWVSGATDLFLALALNAGINDADASTARLLTQLIPTVPSLNPLKPSVAEALAVDAVGSLLLGAIGSPFIPYYNYTQNPLSDGRYEQFDASFLTESYISATESNWQKVWILELAGLFGISMLLTCYYIYIFFISKKKGLVIDYTESQNLFATAMNSPPSALLAGSCAGGPNSEQLLHSWRMKTRLDTGHVFLAGQETQGVRMAAAVDDSDTEMHPIRRMVQRSSTMSSIFTLGTTYSWDTLASRRNSVGDLELV